MQPSSPICPSGRTQSEASTPPEAEAPLSVAAGMPPRGVPQMQASPISLPQFIAHAAKERVAVISPRDEKSSDAAQAPDAPAGPIFAFLRELPSRATPQRAVLPPPREQGAKYLTLRDEDAMSLSLPALDLQAPRGPSTPECSALLGDVCARMRTLVMRSAEILGEVSDSAAGHPAWNQAVVVEFGDPAAGKLFHLVLKGIADPAKLMLECVADHRIPDPSYDRYRVSGQAGGLLTYFLPAHLVWAPPAPSRVQSGPMTRVLCLADSLRDNRDSFAKELEVLSAKPLSEPVVILGDARTAAACARVDLRLIGVWKHKKLALLCAANAEAPELKFPKSRSKDPGDKGVYYEVPAWLLAYRVPGVAAPLDDKGAGARGVAEKILDECFAVQEAEADAEALLEDLRGGESGFEWGGAVQATIDVGDGPGRVELSLKEVGSARSLSVWCVTEAEGESLEYELQVEELYPSPKSARSESAEVVLNSAVSLRAAYGRAQGALARCDSAVLDEPVALARDDFSKISAEVDLRLRKVLSAEERTLLCEARGPHKVPYLKRVVPPPGLPAGTYYEVPTWLLCRREPGAAKRPESKEQLKP